MPAGCGGSPAYAPRNRFPVVGMRYGPLPLFNHSTPIDPPSRQSLRALSYPTQNTTRYVQLYSAGCNKRTHGRSGELFDDNGENVNIDLVVKDHFDIPIKATGWRSILTNKVGFEQRSDQKHHILSLAKGHPAHVKDSPDIFEVI